VDRRPPSGSRTELGSIAAIPLAAGVVLSGYALHGGSVRSLLDPAAALIVCGGTLAATLVTHSPSALVAACRAAWSAFRSPAHDTSALTSDLLVLAIRAHRYGVVALDAEVERIADPFLRNGLTLAIDGTSTEVLRDVMNAEKRAREADDELPARVFETAAGYAPTLGIIGAVLGLIQVLGHLNTPSSLGAGIAVAFIATFYGIGLANLVLLPIGGRLRERAVQASHRRDLILEALPAVQQRMNPRIVAQRMRAYTPGMPAIEDLAAKVKPRRRDAVELAS
jgi:chemotaxis protein MotA